MPKNDKKLSQFILPRRKILEAFVAMKYYEASDANITDKSPQKKVWHENLAMGEKKVVDEWIYIWVRNE